jgi:hypothetical protein
MQVRWCYMSRNRRCRLPDDDDDDELCLCSFIQSAVGPLRGAPLRMGMVPPAPQPLSSECCWLVEKRASLFFPPFPWLFRYPFHPFVCRPRPVCALALGEKRAAAAAGCCCPALHVSASLGKEGYKEPKALAANSYA